MVWHLIMGDDVLKCGGPDPLFKRYGPYIQLPCIEEDWERGTIPTFLDTGSRQQVFV